MGSHSLKILQNRHDKNFLKNSNTMSLNTNKMSLTQLKSQIINEINKNSHEFLEEWKQIDRTQKAKILASKREVIIQLTNSIQKLNKINKIENSLNSIEHLRRKMLAQIRQKANNQVIEEWKINSISNKVEIYDNRNRLLNSIKCSKRKTSQDFVELTPIKKSKVEQRSQLLQDIRFTKCEQILPKWKENYFNQIRATIDYKIQISLDVVDKNVVKSAVKDCKKREENLNQCSMNQRKQLMAAIRSKSTQNDLIESWKQNIRTNLSEPLILKQKLLGDLLSSKVTLKSNVDKRDALMRDLNKEINLDIEAWKQIRKQQILDNLKNKRRVLNEILCSSGKNLLTRTPSRINLMEQIRSSFNEKSAITTLLVENWKQNERNTISNNLSNKNIILGEILSINSNGLNLRHVKNSQLIMHKHLLNKIRSAPIPEWKEMFFAIKIKAIQNKHNVCLSVQNGQFKLNCNVSPVDQKIKICAQIRSKFQNLNEEWKQVKYNSYAKAIGQKYLTNLSIKNFQKINLK